MVAVHCHPKTMLDTCRRMLLAVGILFTVSAFGHCNGGCVPPKSAAEVEAAYTAEIVHCSATAKTLEEAKACRRDVNTKYGLCERDSWPRITPCDE